MEEERRPLEIAFFGTGPFAVPVVERLLQMERGESGIRVRAVVTRPDRPAGRGRKLQPTPVREACQRLDVDVHAPETVNDATFLDSLCDEGRMDLFLVADYGEFLRPIFREHARIGAYNLHGSILPRHRGAAPVAHAILAGDSVSGVTLFRIVREMDAGPVVSTIETAIRAAETAGELEQRLSVLAADLLESSLPAFVDGTVREVEQDHAAATLAPKLTKQQGEIVWSLGAESVARRVRAMHPWPVAHAVLHRAGEEKGERLRILRAVDAPDAGEASPGEVVAVSGEGIVVACVEGAVRITELQRPGKSALGVDAFLRGSPVHVGDRFAASSAVG